MPTAKELLGIEFHADNYGKSAEGIVEHAVEKKRKAAIKTFKKVVDQHTTYKKATTGDQKRLHRLFHLHVREGQASLQEAFTTSREVRRLAWTLCYRSENYETIARSQPLLEEALVLIDRKWRWGMLFPLFDALLRIWNCGPTRGMLQKFVGRKLLEYDGRRPRIQTLQEHQNRYTRPDGPAQLAGYLLRERKALSLAQDVLNLPRHVQGYAYFGDVAAAYTRSAMRSDAQQYIGPILDFLKTHKRAETYKRCLGSIILHLDRTGALEHRDRVLRVAFRKIGDPTHESNWQPWRGASSSERDELETARKTLNNWIAQRFITAFFDKVAMDEDRREFWMRYVTHITNFMVFGDEGTRYKLKQDERTNKYVQSRFRAISGAMSALLIQVKDRVIVEFGEVGGACYIHKKGTKTCPSFDGGYTDISELRLGTGFPLLMRYSGRDYRNVKQEGRLLHKHEWQRRLDWWMRRQLNIDVRR